MRRALNDSQIDKATLLKYLIFTDIPIENLNSPTRTETRGTLERKDKIFHGSTASSRPKKNYFLNFVVLRIGIFVV